MAEWSAPEIPAIWLYFLEHLHGAVSRVGPTETAFPHRAPGYSFAALALWMDAVDADASTGWVRNFFDAMSPFLRSGVYSNYLAEEGAARVRAAYGPAYDRLLAVKRTYDPTNFFRLNQNVAP